MAHVGVKAVALLSQALTGNRHLDPQSEFVLDWRNGLAIGIVLVVSEAKASCVLWLETELCLTTLHACRQAYWCMRVGVKVAQNICCVAAWHKPLGTCSYHSGPTTVTEGLSTASATAVQRGESSRRPFAA
jgi:hypothetical protein